MYKNWPVCSEKEAQMQKNKPKVPKTRCPDCKGTGLDKTAAKRYTTGGHDQRDCKTCNGECFI